MVQVIDQRSGGEKPEVSQSTGPDGRTMIRVMIRDEMRRGLSQGDYDSTLRANYGLARTGVGR